MFHDPHESPDHQGDDQHHAEGVDSRRGLEKEVVDHERILEGGEVALDPVLPLVALSFSLYLHPIHYEKVA